MDPRARCEEMVELPDGDLVAVYSPHRRVFTAWQLRIVQDDTSYDVIADGTCVLRSTARQHVDTWVRVWMHRRAMM